MTTITDLQPRAPQQPADRRHRRPRAVAAALAALVVLALAGCMKIDMEFTLSEEDTVSGSIVMAISNDFADSVGMDPQDLWDSANQGDDSLTDELPEGSSEEPYSDGEYTGTRITYADQPIESMSTGTDELSITREGDEYVVQGVMDMSGAAEDAEELGDMPADMMEGFDIRIAVTFPGEVGETNGEVDGTTVSWHPQFGESTEILARGSAVAGASAGGSEDTDEAAPGQDEATGGSADGDDTSATDTAEVSDESGFPWWMVGLVLGLAILGGIVALVVRNNRDPRPPSSDPQDVFGPGAPRADYGQPQSPAPPVIPPQQGPADPYRPPADPNSTPHEPR
ncbi:LppM family (lipo)protein [Isoptericola aurantiacus]|uniref:LppM family (lipo)protein n=1 Tax=Isoptericola aurantiacus TaxID=3377839 RepID=UPI00383A38F0